MPKKKSSAKNPQRGFATTSVIKKKEPEPEPEVVEAVDAVSLRPGKGSSPQAENATNVSVAEAGGNWDDSEAVKAEEERAALTERVRAASEKEASKTLKVIEYEKRVSKSYEDFNWDDPTGIRDRVIELAIAESDASVPTTYNESDEKLLVRIASLYLILRRLGFTKEQVENCIKKVQDLELDDAVRWLYLRHEPKYKTSLDQEDETVRPYGLGHWPDEKLAIPTSQPKPQMQVKPAIVPTAVQSVTAKLDPETQAKSSANGSKASSLLAYRSHDSDSDSSDDEASTKPSTTPSLAASKEPSDNEEDIEDDPDGAYVKLKLRVTTLHRKLGIAGKTGGKKGAKAKPKAPTPISNGDKGPDHIQLEQLEAKLKEIQSMYLFNAKKAEAAFAIERAKLDKAELAERLAGKVAAREAQETPVDDKAARSTNSTESAQEPINNDKQSKQSEPLQEQTEASLFGDMLEDPESLPVAETPLVNESGSIVTVRSMPLPKNYTGKTPRTLLDEAMRRIDRYAKVTYRLLSRSSRAVRAVVTLRWESGKFEQYGMDDEACENQDQAFQYVATLALFAITPINDGGAIRLLPPVFRDFWDELSKRRQAQQATAYEAQMQIYDSLAAARRAQPGREEPKQDTMKSAPSSDAALPHSNGHLSRTPREAGETLQQAVLAKQSTPAYQNMLSVRRSLPISAYRDSILSIVQNNQVAVLCGETGCGKSTQTPSMILENELEQGRHVRIFCTEPRRISAISLAQRVSQELGEAPGSLGSRSSYVGYNIRLEARVSASTRLTYATTGILLRMLEGDTELNDVTHIIIDEVHERTIDSDFLLIILKSLLKRRKDLRILLMSATVDAEKISAYMGNCPVINVPGRTFPVTPHFLEDAVELSGYHLSMDSDSPYVQRLQRNQRKILADDDLIEDDETDGPASVLQVGYSKRTQSTLQAMNEYMINFDLIVTLLETICFQNPAFQPFSQAILVFLPSLETIRKLCDMLESHPGFGTAQFIVLPLHSSISNEQQARVFNIPSRGVRKIVVSTNIAETGVTIPDVTAVIDSGRHKEIRFDEKRQISRLIECWIAKSNAMQRRGRAGRVQEGICFHMFTKNRMETALADHPLPEMLRLSLQDLALRIKILKFPGSIEHTLLQALDPPLTVNIQRAVASLIDVKALTASEDITQLGRQLVKLPLDVYTAKLCLLASIFGCLDAALTIAATLNSKSFFVTPFGREGEADSVKRSFKSPDEHSDFLVIYRAYKAWRSNCENGGWSVFCRKHFLSHTNLIQVEELKNQYLGNLIDAGFISKENGSMRYARGPKTRFARLEEHLDRTSDDGQVVMAVIAAAMHPKLLYVDASGQWKTLSNNAPVAIHPSSSNFVHGRRPDFGRASFMTFFNIQQSKRLYVWENGVVEDRAVMLLSGDADVKHFSSSTSIDRKIRRHTDRRTGLAIEQLRQKYDILLQARLDNPSMPLSEAQASWFALLQESLTFLDKGSETKRVQDRDRVSVNVVKR